jgi:hypothetical protein
LIVEDSKFYENTSDAQTGALNSYNSHLEVRRCLFVQNASFTTGAIHMFESTGIVEADTLYENSSPGRASVFMNFSPSAEVSSNIISSDLIGAGLRFDGGAGPHTCNILWNNAAGAIQSTELDPTELLVDPQFCDATADDFSVASNSAAAQGTPECPGGIGAFEAGCGGLPRVVLTAEDVLVEAGTEEVALQVTVGMVDAETVPIDLAGLDFELAWDPLLLELRGLELAEESSDWSMAFNDEIEGEVRISLARAVGLQLTEAGVPLLNLDLAVRSEFEETDLRIEEARAYDSAPQELPIETIDGSIRMTCDEGDLDRNDSVNSADAVLALQIAAEFRVATAYQMCAGDLNSNESGDAVLILRRAVGLDGADKSEGPVAQLTVEREPGAIHLHLFAAAGAELTMRGIRGLVLDSVESTVGLVLSNQADDMVTVVSANANVPPEGISIDVFGQGVESATLIESRLYSDSGSLTEHTIVESGGGQTAAPGVAALHLEIAPNPFNPSTEFRFDVREPSLAFARVYNEAGREVWSSGVRLFPRGQATIRWNGTDQRGTSVASGSYVVAIEVGSQVLRSRALLLK